MVESKIPAISFLQLFEDKLEETARLYFSNSNVTVDLYTTVYNCFFWGLAIPSMLYLFMHLFGDEHKISSFMGGSTGYGGDSQGQDILHSLC